MIAGIALALAGLAVGSFLNVCIDRLPERQSPVSPRSRCDACGKPVDGRDLVPVVSYVLLRGRCRHCRAAIPLRVPLVEATTALVFAGCWWRMGLSWQTLIVITSMCALIVVGVITVEHGLSLNRREEHKSW